MQLYLGMKTFNSWLEVYYSLDCSFKREQNEKLWRVTVISFQSFRLMLSTLKPQLLQLEAKSLFFKISLAFLTDQDKRSSTLFLNYSGMQSPSRRLWSLF